MTHRNEEKQRLKKKYLLSSLKHIQSYESELKSEPFSCRKNYMLFSNTNILCILAQKFHCHAE